MENDSPIVLASHPGPPGRLPEGATTQGCADRRCEQAARFEQLKRQRGFTRSGRGRKFWSDRDGVRWGARSDPLIGEDPLASARRRRGRHDGGRWAAAGIPKRASNSPPGSKGRACTRQRPSRPLVYGARQVGRARISSLACPRSAGGIPGVPLLQARRSPARHQASGAGIGKVGRQDQRPLGAGAV